MLIYGVSGIFSDKKTIKQFLQPMIKQVGGGGGEGEGSECAGRMCCFSHVSFSVATVFLSCFFFQFTDAFFSGRFVPFLLYIVYFIKKSNSVLGTKFS